MPSHDPQAALDVLRARGAERRDPLRFHFLQTLAARAQQSEGELRRHLVARFDLALKSLAERLDHAATEPGHDVERAASAPLAALAGLRRRLDADVEPAASPAAPRELKSVRYFGATWARLSVERQIGEVLQREPANAGPLNSHLLVLRALAAMRELSPAYLMRFMIHADALLSLDHAVAAVRAPARPAGVRKKPRTAASRTPSA